MAGVAFGIMICGWALQFFTEILHWDLLYSYRAIFVLYATVGLVKLSLTIALSRSVESEKKQKQNGQTLQQRNEATPLLASEGPSNIGEQGTLPDTKRKTGLRKFLPDIHRDSATVVTVLCLLFALDAFGTGVNPL